MSPGLLAAADWFEILAALIFFLITGIAQWVQKRNQARRTSPPQVPADLSRWSSGERPGTRPPTPPETVEDWQDQLRRMLSGEETTEAPPRSRSPAQPAALPPPLPLPPPTPARQSSSPEPVSTATPWYEESEASPSWEDRPAPQQPLTTLQDAADAYERGAQVEATTTSRLTTSASLAAARQAFQQASKLHERVSTRMHAALARSESHPSLHPVHTPAPVTAQASLRAILRRPDSARRAILVAALLERPKGLD